MKPLLPLRGIWLFVLLTLLTGLPLTGIASAQENGPTDDEVNAIAKGMYCPVCENIPLDVCPTQACIQWREVIRQKLAEGWDEAQIKDYFVAQYGDRVLAEPPPQGLNWLVYLVPPLIFLSGAYLLFGVFRSWRRQPQPGPAAAAPSNPDDDYVRRLEEEL
ncbi:MAG TPA: cytochrome c-type biogenesis protein CcmH [Anaerolineales bacterium]|nr:cytochrome c-type biogenesis protein CcmH [Anaerolineales bacterium]